MGEEEKLSGVNTDGADWPVVLKELRYCATCWENKVRLIGNIRAEDIIRATLLVEAELNRKFADGYALGRKDAELLHDTQISREIKE